MQRFTRRKKNIYLQVGVFISLTTEYLGTNLSSTNDDHEEINKRITSTNKCLYALLWINEVKVAVKEF